MQLPALLGLVRGVLVHRLQLSDVQSRHLFV
jgi:hypothetical protein